MMKKYILLCFCLGFVISPALAQHQDSIVKARKEADALDAVMRRRTEADSAYQVKFNALRYSMQKRYRPKDVNFVNERFFDNTSISLWGGYNQIVPRGGVDLNGGIEAGLSFSKFFNPTTGMRLSGSWTIANRDIDTQSWNNYGVTADHLFNLSSAVLGYSPNRRFEALTVLGVGYHLSTLNGVRKTAADGHLGMLLKWNTGTRLDIFAEPRLTFYTDGIDLSNQQQNWRKYDVGLSAMVGFNYRLGTYYKPGTSDNSEDSFMDNTFISAGMGMQLNKGFLNSQSGTLNSMGPIFHVAVGKWFLDAFGLRMSVFGSSNSWERYRQATMDRLAVYAGGRAEVMINPFAFFREDVRNMRWAVIPMLGVEKGIMKKQHADGAISKSYTGITGGLQLKYYASNNFAFYVEPRISRIPYAMEDKKSSGKIEKRSYYDNLINASIGIELRRPTRDDWRQQAALRGSFVPYYYVQAGAGIASSQQLNKSVSRRFGYMMAGALGRQFTSLSGVRLGIDANKASTYTVKGTIDRYSFVSASMNYMFDISNLVLGYNPERRFGSELFFGPVITECLAPRKRFVGAEGGVRVYMNLLEQFDLYAEPKVRMYKNRYMPAMVGDGTPLQLSLTMGTSYRFGSSYNASLSRGFGDGTFLGSMFISASVGSQHIANRSLDIHPAIAAGPTVNVSIGKWLLPFWGVRGSLFGGYSTWSRVNLGNNSYTDKLSFRAGGRVEALLNLAAIGNQEWRETRWGFTPMFGLEIGQLNKQSTKAKDASLSKKYTGITAAVQAKYYINNNMGLFIEPRLTRVPYEYVAVKNGARTSAVDNVVSLNVGFEFRASRKSEREQFAVFTDGFEPYNYASFHAGLSMPMLKTRKASRWIGYELGGLVTRQFSPLSALRAGIDFNTVPKDRKNSNSFVNLSVDYLFDISNCMGGYDPERKIGMEVLAGPVFSVETKRGDVFIGAEGGLRAYHKLQNGFDIYMEPKIRMFSREKSSGVKPASLQMMFSVGTSYKF